MVRTKRRYPLLLLTVLVTACGSISTPGSQPVAPSTSTGPAAPIQIHSTSDGPEMAPTGELAEPPTPVPSSTPASTPTASTSMGYRRNCLTVEETVPSGFLAEGAIILDSLGQDDTRLYALMSNASGLRPLSGDMDDARILISPDKKRFAYDLERVDSGGQRTSTLEVRNLDGRQHWSIPYGANWRYVHYWVDDEHIALEYWLDLDGTPEWRMDSGMIIVNTFTGHTKDINSSSLPFFDMPGTAPVYDPTLSRVLYPRYDPGDFPSLVLWDLPAGRELWRMQVSDTLWHIYPQWSSDGSRFVVGGPQGSQEIHELAIVDRDGRVQHLSQLETAGIRAGMITFPQWSPDERSIAFWLSGSLAVYDLATGSVTDYCIASSDAKSFRPHWSPDSQQLVFINDNESYSGPRRGVVVDIRQNRAIEVGRDYYVEGWMDEE